MSRLREMIKELCPDGVEYCPIKDCVESVEKIEWKKTDETYRYIDLSSVDRDDHTIGETLEISADDAPSRAQQVVKENDILLGTTRPMLKRYCQIPSEYDNQICSTGFCVLRANNTRVLSRWLYHMISTTAFFDYVDRTQHGSSYPAISDKEVKAYDIPVPPLPIQNEIVKLLDNFTELTAELTAELQLRKKQYSFYRDSLLNFSRDDVDVEWKTLGEMCRLKAGTAIAALNISTNATADSAVPCYGGNGLRGYVRQANQSEDAPLIGRQGALCGNVCYATAPYYATEHAVVVDGLGHFDNRFLFHILRNMNLSQYKTAGAQPGLSVKRLNQVHIAVPTIEAQKRIADVLDRFDALCNDLTQGLPAEIAARKKQYEYYRDKLLTFQRKGA